jgi:cell division protein FtsW
MISRAERGALSEWWWTVDRPLFFIVLALIGIGLMLAVAASPAASGGPDDAGNFGYALRQIGYALGAVGILIGVSLLPPAKIAHLALAVFVLALIGTLLAHVVGVEVLGARRWLKFGSMTVQPSEFLKPGFAVLAAAILASPQRPGVSRPALTLVLFLPAMAALLMQPDVGQSFLLLALWAALLFFAGMSWQWLAGIGASAAALGVSVYHLFSYVHHRIQQFVDPTEAAYQAWLSLRAFAHGGLTGVGPGAGTVKYRLPYAHSDYIFAVAGEEFGLVLCAGIALLFCLLAVRLMMRASAARAPFAQLAGAGLAVVVALQAFINMGVAVSLLPAKGMTLPFISYGGSSLFAVALTMGFALALTRTRPPLMGEETVTLFGKAFP